MSTNYISDGNSKSSFPQPHDSSQPTTLVESSEQKNIYENSQPSTPLVSTSSPLSNPIIIGEEDSNTTLGKRKHTSVVWEHFSKTTIDGLIEAICNYCKQKLGGDPKNGTKHLHDHLKRCPRYKNADVKQKLLTSNFNKVDGKINAYVFDEGAARKELSNMIIMHEYPLSIVDIIGFRRYSSALQPLFKMVTRNTIKNDILKICDYERGKTMNLVKKNKSRVAITMDMWIAGNQKKGFIVVTTHFIDESWILQSRILRFMYVPCPHTKEVLCDTLVSCLLDSNVEGKLSTVTIDNCSTNDAMIDLVLDKLNSDSLLLGGSFFHMRCSAHILNLAVKDGLDVIKDGIVKIRDSVAYWTVTPKRQEKFEETSRQLRMNFEKKLRLDCLTRWNSTYLMLQTALLYKNVFFRLKQRESQYKCCPSEEEWEFANEICGRLKIFFDVTEVFSGTKYPTANLYFPKICEIRLTLSKWLSSSNVVVKTMASNMIKKFDKYWTVIHGIMGVAAVLDPRYKMNLIEYYFPKLYGDGCLDEIGKVRKFCYDLFDEYRRRLDKDGVVSSSSRSQSIDSSNQDALSEYDLFVSLKRTTKSIHAKSELDHYLDEDVLPRTIDFDILSWWKLRGLKYPTLQAIARDVLAIPVSTVSSESAFSTAVGW